MSTLAFVLAPAKSPSAPLEKAVWKELTSGILEVRGRLDKLPSRKGSRASVYMRNQLSLDSMSLGDAPDGDDELARLRELASRFPGEYVAAWTYRHSFTIIRFSSRPDSADDPEVRELSFRLRAPGERDLYPELAALLEGSPLDWSKPTLRKALSEDPVRVPKLFAALGIPGARNLEAEDPTGPWEAFEIAATDLLRGGPATPGARKVVNDALRAAGSKAELPATPRKRAGEIPWLVSDLVSVMARNCGAPVGGRWSERLEPVGDYWDMNDSHEVVDQLVAGTGVAEEAGLARVLLHYPAELLRDPIFLALEAEQVQEANGRAYVDGFTRLAERTHIAGMHIAVFPGKRRREIREALGMHEIGSPPRPGKVEAEVFIELGRVNTAKALAKLGEDVEVHYVGPEEPLDPREAVRKLGHGDLLKPGKWQSSSRGSETDKTKRALERKARAALANLPGPTAVADLSSLADRLDPRIDCGSTTPVVVRIRPANPDSMALRELAADLGDGAMARHGHAFVDGNAVIMTNLDPIPRDMLLRVLGDVAPGTEAAIKHHRGRLNVKIGAPASAAESEGTSGKKKRTTKKKAAKKKPAAAKKAAKKKAVKQRRLSAACYDPNQPDKHNPHADLDKVAFDISYNGIKASNRAITGFVHKGKRGRSYYEIDSAALQFPKDRRSDLATGRIENLGFQVVGDVAVPWFPLDRSVIRVYSRPGPTFACSFFTPGSRIVHEFYTRFEDGSTLTSTNEFGIPIAFQDGRCVQKKGVAAGKLYAAHKREIKKVGLTAAEHDEVTLAAFCQEFERRMKWYRP